MMTRRDDVGAELRKPSSKEELATLQKRGEIIRKAVATREADQRRAMKERAQDAVNEVAVLVNERPRALERERIRSQVRDEVREEVRKELAAEELGRTESGRVKLTVNLPERDMVTLRSIAARRDMTLTDAIRRAIAMEQFIEEVESQGGKLLVEQPDHSMRQLVLR